MVTLPRGAEAAEELSKESRGGARGRLDFFTLKDKDGEREALLRFLTDRSEWIPLPVHSFIPVDRPADLKDGDKWPKSMWFVCQNANAFRRGGNPDADFEPGYGNCWIHANLADQADQFKKPLSKADAQTFSLAVIRKPKRDQATGEIIGLEDEMVEFKDKEGNTHLVPHIVLVSQKWTNFFSAVANAAYIDKTVLDKDFRIVRDGNDYTISMVGATPDHKPGTPSWEIYAKALEIMGGFDLETYLLEHASAEHYARFLPVNGKPPLAGRDNGKAAAASGREDDAAPAGGAPAATDKEISDFAARLRGSGNAQADEPAAAG